MARVRFPVDALFIDPAALAQLGERQTEDLKVPGSIPGVGSELFISLRRRRTGTEDSAGAAETAWASWPSG